MIVTARRVSTVAMISALTVIAGVMVAPAASAAANSAPVTFGDSNTITEDAVPATVSGNLLTNDTDPDGDALVIFNPGRSQLTYGNVLVLADGSYTYELDNSNSAVQALNLGQHLTDTFTYIVTDGNGGTVVDVLLIRINGTTDNSAPSAYADGNIVKEDATPNPVTGNVLTNDADADGNILAVTNPGTVTLTYGQLVINANGTYLYTLDNSNPAVNALNQGQTLSDTFTYSVSDGHGGTATEVLTITIRGTTDTSAPVASPDALLISEDAVPATVSGNVLTNDSDAQGDTLTIVTTGTVPLDYGTLSVGVDGAVAYTLDNANPLVNALHGGQSLTDTYTYTVSDGSATDSTTLTVTILGFTDNRAPSASADTASVVEDAVPNTTTGTLLANDSDADGDTLSVTTAGTFTLTYGSLVIASDGTYVYTLDNANPAVNALTSGQSLIDSYSATVSDGRGGTASATLTITIVGSTDATATPPTPATPLPATPLPATTLHVAAPDSLLIPGEAISVTARGLAPREAYVIRLGGRIVARGVSSATGTVSRAITIPKSLGGGTHRVAVVGSLATRTGTDTIRTVLLRKELTISSRPTTVEANRSVTFTVSGLAKGEPVTVVFNGKRISAKTAKATAEGSYSVRVPSGWGWGTRTVTATGITKTRHGATTVDVGPRR